MPGAGLWAAGSAVSELPVAVVTPGVTDARGMGEPGGGTRPRGLELRLDGWIRHWRGAGWGRRRPLRVLGDQRARRLGVLTCGMSPPGLGGYRYWGGRSCTQHGVCVSTRPGVTQHFRPQPECSPGLQRPLHQPFLFRVSRGCLLGSVCLPDTL